MPLSYLTQYYPLISTFKRKIYIFHLPPPHSQNLPVLNVSNNPKFRSSKVLNGSALQPQPDLGEQKLRYHRKRACALENHTPVVQFPQAEQGFNTFNSTLL